MEDAEKFKLITSTRAKILRALERNEKHYNKLLGYLGLEAEMSQEEGYLFDLVFNTPDEEEFKMDFERWLNLHKNNTQE